MTTLGWLLSTTVPSVRPIKGNSPSVQFVRPYAIQRLRLSIPLLPSITQTKMARPPVCWSLALAHRLQYSELQSGMQSTDFPDEWSADRLMSATFCFEVERHRAPGMSFAKPEEDRSEIQTEPARSPRGWDPLIFLVTLVWP